MNSRLPPLLALFAVGAALVWFSPEDQFGVWSLAPALITIVVCFLTRNVLLALFFGVVSGGLIAGEYNLVRAYLVPSLGTESYAQILLVYLWALGGLLGLWSVNGGAQYFARRVGDIAIRSRISAKVFAWFLGILFFQGGTISTVLAGTTVRPVSDKHKVSHEELAYIVDSTASPVATIIPLNVWPIYVAGLILIEPMRAWVPDEASAFQLFYSAIPFNFYAIFAVSMTLLLAVDRLPLFGTPMAKAIARVAKTGELDDPDDSPLLDSELSDTKPVSGYDASLIDFFAPIGTLMAFCIVPLMWGPSPMVFEGFAAAVVVAVLVSVVRGLEVGVALDGFVSGVKSMTVGALVLALAVTLATVSSALGTAEYVVSQTADLFTAYPAALPGLLTVVSMFIAFSLGSAWGTYAVMFPLAMPIAFTVSADPVYAAVCFGALLGGGVFGDNCSPISDTTILSSLACGADVMAHVRTQLPLAMIAALLSVVCSTLVVISL
ncbi:MAG: Na+/H+ antiporter NhaC family protein [Pseudomonadota bacterium]